jgi:hypothetical protein
MYIPYVRERQKDDEKEHKLETRVLDHLISLVFLLCQYAMDNKTTGTGDLFFAMGHGRGKPQQPKSDNQRNKQPNNAASLNACICSILLTAL